MTPEGSPLRLHGIYRYDGVEYTAVHLSTDGRPWGSTALLHPPGGGAPRRILYLRHADGALLDAIDFRPTDGTLLDLIDTGRTDALD
jgi:hypothetical protein